MNDYPNGTFFPAGVVAVVILASAILASVIWPPARTGHNPASTAISSVLSAKTLAVNAEKPR